MMKTTQRYLLMFMLLLSSMSGWAQETQTATIDFSTMKYYNKRLVPFASIKDVADFNFDSNGGTSPAYYDTGKAVRLYAGNSMTVTSPYKIVSVAIVGSRDTHTWNKFTSDVGTCTANGNNVLWNASNSFTSSVTITNHNTGSGTLRIATITVTYQSETLSPPSQVTFTPAAGTYTESQSVTLSTDNAGKLYYTTDGTSATSSSIEYTGAITVGKSMTINAYAVNDKGSVSASAAYVIQPAENITLDENADNSQTISDNNGKVANVTLMRTFTARNGWYTLCLPFALTRAQIISAFGSDVVVQTYSSATLQDNHVNINFTDYTSNLAAGWSCLIKIPTKTVTNPTFNGVTISSSATTTFLYDGKDGEFQVVGIYSPTAITGSASDAMKYRFVNNQGTGLAYPSDGGASKLKGTRVYFILPTAVQAKQAVLVTGDDGSTGIREVSNGQKLKNQYVYDLQGKRLGDGSAQSIQHLPKGIYVMNGKKVVIK